MERLSRKLHSSRGASMLLGLLYLLVCLTVGAVVLTAAATSAGRTERNRREQQNYLAVASAVELVKEDLANAKFTGSYFIETKEWSETVDTDKTDDKGKPVTETKDYSETTYGKNEASLTGSTLLCTDAVFADIKALYYKNTTHFGDTVPAEMTYMLSFAADRDIPAVNGTLTVVKGDDLYTLLVYLETADGTNGTTLLFRSNPSNPPSTSTSYWDADEIHYEKITYTTTVTWNTPEIRKGAVS